MIKEVKMYTIVCDCCGEDAFEDSGYSCWNAEQWAENEVVDGGWIKQEDKHYCPDCVEYNDNDELIIKHNGKTI